MKCEERLLLLDEYWAGTMAHGTSAAMEAHWVGCDSRQAACGVIWQTFVRCRAIEPYELPVEFHDRLHRALREQWTMKLNRRASHQNVATSQP
ncbi:MAG: hypothetical protein Q8N18_11220 [Opitutaceae bacterium]|nr:hypothetical protein [Opitutaceae bacterium]